MLQTMKRGIKQIYLGIALSLLFIVLLSFLLSAWLRYDSQVRILGTLSEVSDQSVQVLQKEISKCEILLSNLAAVLGQEENPDPEVLIQKLAVMDRQNRFKRMGLVYPDYSTYTTDDAEIALDDDGYQRFAAAMEGQTAVTDVVEDLADGKQVTVFSTPLYFQDGSRCVLFGTYSSDYYR